MTDWSREELEETFIYLLLHCRTELGLSEVELHCSFLQNFLLMLESQLRLSAVKEKQSQMLGVRSKKDFIQYNYSMGKTSAHFHWIKKQDTWKAGCAKEKVLKDVEWGLFVIDMLGHLCLLTEVGLLPSHRDWALPWWLHFKVMAPRSSRKARYISKG